MAIWEKANQDVPLYTRPCLRSLIIIITIIIITIIIIITNIY